MQRTPAGFPFGIPGIDDEIDGAIQQAAQLGRQALLLIHVGMCFRPTLVRLGDIFHPKKDE
jgi:hypothetical protein